jgi:type IX secretion system PorP/SprF family membrane protein
MRVSKKRTLFFFSFIMLFPQYSFGQDLTFSQFYSNQLYLNPAFAGNPHFKRLNLTYRNQWLQGNTPYATYGLSYDKFFPKSRSGFGFILINDVQGHGAINRASMDLIYSHTVQVAYNFQLKGGLQFGGVYKSQNASNLIFPDMIDHTGNVVGDVNFAGQSKFFPDLAAGVAAQWDVFYGGISAHHLAEPIEVDIEAAKVKVPRKYTAYLGCDLSVYKRYILRNTLIISPNIIYIKQGDFHQINIGGQLIRNELAVGIWLKENKSFNSSTFMVLAGYQNESYRIGYSYDFSLLYGGFRGIKTSTHEVTFGMNFKYKVKARKKNRHIINPKF